MKSITIIPILFLILTLSACNPFDSTIIEVPVQLSPGTQAVCFTKGGPLLVKYGDVVRVPYHTKCTAVSTSSQIVVKYNDAESTEHIVLRGKVEVDYWVKDVLKLIVEFREDWKQWYDFERIMREGFDQDLKGSLPNVMPEGILNIPTSHLQQALSQHIERTGLPIEVRSVKITVAKAGKGCGCHRGHDYSSWDW